MDGVLPVLSGKDASPPHLASNAEQVRASPLPAQAASNAVEFWIRLLRSGARASRQNSAHCALVGPPLLSTTLCLASSAASVAARRAARSSKAGAGAQANGSIAGIGASASMQSSSAAAASAAA